MNKGIKLAAACAAAAIIAVTGATVAGGDLPEPAPEAVEASGIEAKTISVPAPQYMLRELDGYIAIYIGGALEAVTEIPVGLLRYIDQAALIEGIELSSYEELLMLIDDFSS